MKKILKELLNEDVKVVVIIRDNEKKRERLIFGKDLTNKEANQMIRELADNLTDEKQPF